MAQRAVEAAPLRFERNEGQSGNAFDFVSQGNGYAMFVHPAGALMTIGSGQDSSNVGLTLVGSHADARPVTAEPSGTLVNYYFGQDRSRWHTGVRSFGRIRYTGVYDGVDVEYYGHGADLEYDFIVAPGGDPSRISLAFDGMKATCIDGDGALVIETGSGNVRHARPYIYQRLSDGSKKEIGGRFVMHDGILGFAVDSFDRSRELVIDPTVTMTYPRLPSVDNLAVDALGNMYLAGSSSFNGTPPTPAQMPPTENMWVMKVNADGSIAYRTYLGGSGNDSPRGLAVDAGGDAYLVGTTSSTNFPTTIGALQPSMVAATDLAICKLNAAGVLVLGTYFGAEGSEDAVGIAVDAATNIYVAGTTTSHGLPGTIDNRSFATGGSFVAKITPDGSSIAWLSMIDNVITAMTLDNTGAVYVGGNTANNSYAFAAKLTSTGGIAYSGVINGNDVENATAIAVDSSHNVYIGGNTWSSNLPTTWDAIQQLIPSPFVSSGYLVKFDPTLSQILYATYLGGGVTQGPTDISIDGADNINVLLLARADRTGPSSGWVWYSGFPLVDNFSSSVCLSASGGWGAYLLRLNTANNVQYSVCFPQHPGARLASYAGDVWLAAGSQGIRRVSTAGTSRLVVRDWAPPGSADDQPSHAFNVFSEHGSLMGGQVYFGTSLAVLDTVNAQMLAGTAPNLPAGEYNITVQTPAGETAILSHGWEAVTGNFMSPPSPSSVVTPNTVTGSGSEVVTITGTAFPPNSWVVLRSRTSGLEVMNPPSYRVDSHTIVAVMSGAPVDFYDVIVRVGKINGAIPANNTVVAALTVTGPSISTFTTTGNSAGGEEFVVRGPSVNSTTTVSLGGVSLAPNTTTGSCGGNTTCKSLITPALPPGRVDVIIGTSSGMVTYQGGFLFVQDVHATDVQPRSGSTYGGTTVTITGSGFQTGARVAFSDIEASNVVVSNGGATITATTPPHAAGNTNVVVINPDGSHATVATTSPIIYSFIALATSLTPTSGPMAGGTSVTITGNGLDGTCRVFFGGVEGVVTSAGGTSLVVTTPAHASGFVDVTINKGTTDSTTLVHAYSFLDVAPTMGGIAPTSGPANGGTAVTITGTGFSPSAVVKFGGRTLQNPVITATSITGTTPSNNPGATGVSVTNPDGQVVTTTFTYTAVPTVSTISPTSGTQAGGTTVTLTGTGFDPAATVSFGGTPAASISVTSSTSITVTTPAHAYGDVDVTVTNPDGGFVTKAGAFRFLPPAPTITSFTPTIALMGASVTITGTNFIYVTSVTFSNNVVAIITVDSPTQITATVPAGAVTGPITVTTLSGPVTSSTNFVVDTIGPRIDSFTPTSGITGTSVTITGVRFTGASVVQFGGVAASSFIVNSDTQITAVVPATALTGSISVTTSVATGNSGPFFYAAPRFASTAFTPASAPVGATVTINGVNFQGATDVQFNGASAGTITVNPGGTSITTTVPAAATNGPITVVTPVATITTTANFGVAPTITSFTPTSGPAGTIVTITGTRFTGATSVKFAGVAASFTVVNDTTITAAVPAGSPSGSITVTTPGGTATSSAQFLAGPKIVSFTPIKGNVGTSVTISGQYFTGATAVTFNGVSATFTVVNDTTITTTVPTGATSGPIAVTTSISTTTSTAIFSLPLSATGFTPTAGPPGTAVIITGSNFIGTKSVTINGLSAAFVVNSNTQITVTIPSLGSSGVFNITTNYGTVATTGTFTVTAAGVPVVTATASTADRVLGTASVLITWTGSGGDQFDVQRASRTGDLFTTLARVTALSYTDSSAAPDKTYLYRVTKVSTGEVSNVDYATTVMFTDDPLVAGTTLIKAVHITEIRTAVNAMRAAAALGAAVWTDPSPAGFEVKAAHITELRTALTAALTVFGRSIGYTDPALAAGGPIRAVHFQELRDAVK